MVFRIDKSARFVNSPPILWWIGLRQRAVFRYTILIHDVRDITTKLFQ